ncbi:MAG: S26 family signal peptidase [Planctomycetota bacterium]
MATVACATLLGALLLVVRETYGWVFPVASSSMAPTLRPGDWVFVRYARGVPDMHDVVVLAEPDGGATIKRVAALPEDRVVVDVAGDLRVDNVLRDPAEGWPAPTVLFDASLRSIGEAWSHGQGDDARMLLDPWTRTTPAGTDEVWRLNGTLVPTDSDLGLLRFRERIDDGWLEPTGERVAGVVAVHDAVVEFEARVGSPGGVLRVQLVEQGDVFDALVLVRGEGEPSGVYLRQRDLPGPTAGRLPRFLAVGEADVPVGRWFDVRFANVDNHLRLELDGQAFDASYGERNTRHPASPSSLPYSAGERIGVGASRITLDVRGLRVLRDLHYVRAGTFGVDAPLQLGPDEIFVLGDASRGSRDSRQRGPIPVRQVVGRAEAVVWPPRRARGL